MPANKSHHFVPQFLLKQFASDAGGRHLCLYRVRERKHIPQVSIRHQCARNDYYGKDPGLEKLFGMIEGMAAAVIKTITTEERVPEPDTDAIAIFNIFAMLQRGRTPAAVAKQAEADTHLYQNIARLDPRLPKELRPYIDSVRATYPDGLALPLQFAVQYTDLLSDLRLKVLRATGEAEFALGDAPAVLHNQWCRKIRGQGSTGLACSGLQLFLPLSPKHLAIVYDTDIYRVGPSASDIVDVTDDEVLTFNALQYAAADNSVYYRSPGTARHLDLIPSTARENPFGMSLGRYKEEGVEHSYLLVVSHVPMNVDIKPGAVRVRDDRVLVPLQERVRSYRPEAMAAAKAINPKQFERRKEPLKPRGTGVFKLDD